MLQAVITGTPEPRPTWQLNGKALSTGSDVTIENTHECSTLRIRGCGAKHSGAYTVTAENEAGADAAEITVNVLGKW